MNRPGYNAQSGVTLIVSLLILMFSLLILMSMTILGITSMQSTRTEISMAGNLRELGLTFNAAEAGLRAAEAFVDNSITKVIYADPATGLYDDTDEDPDYIDSTTWNTSHPAGTTLAHVIEQPVFIIKYLGDRSQNEVAAVNIGGYGSGQRHRSVRQCPSLYPVLLWKRILDSGVME